MAPCYSKPVSMADADRVRLMAAWGKIFATVGLLALTITACSDTGAPPSGDPDVPTAAATVQHAAASPALPGSDRVARPATPSPVGTSAARPSTTPANAPSATSAPVAPFVPACGSSALTVWEGHTGPPVAGPPGYFATQIFLRNHSGSTCHLRGWPGLTFFGDGIIRGCGAGDPSPRCGKPESTSGRRNFSVTRTSTHDLPDIVLAPAHTTSFTILWSGECHIDPSYGVDIRVPDDARALRLAPTVQISPCEGRVQVTPFGVVG
ncbi:DUF4232 domain-containing protein [Streptomyces sp. NPDC005195]|uniref:DUF4232 domain-containing protein n=1 Tax=Streptomyces sp. NPDC005195 TaxID=3154561 RepID=UPI0033B96D36